MRKHYAISVLLVLRMVCYHTLSGKHKAPVHKKRKQRRFKSGKGLALVRGWWLECFDDFGKWICVSVINVMGYYFLTGVYKNEES